MDDADTLNDFFSTSGPLAQSLTGYQPRAAQIEMAKAIERSIIDNSILIAEAETGIGKTFAYLIPALLSGKKIIVSTGTKNLQDQLYFRDISLLEKALKTPIKKALLKGRANYICLHRLKHNDSRALFTKEEYTDLAKIKKHLPRVSLGEITEFSDVPESNSIWRQVTSTKDNCLGQDCIYYDDCYLVQARKKALKSELIIVNHHLFFADAVLKDDAVGELLPKSDIIVIDEAHQIPEIAQQFFGASVSSRQFRDLSQDIEAEIIITSGDYRDLSDTLLLLQKRLDELHQAFGVDNGRIPWLRIAKINKTIDACEGLVNIIELLCSHLELAQEVSKTFENCYERALGLKAQLTLFLKEESQGEIKWVESYAKSFILHNTPIDIAENMQKMMAQFDCSWVLTSATLQVDKSFAHFTKSLGFTDNKIDTQYYQSPFDYSKQSLCYVPRGLPDPNHSNYTNEVVKATLPVIAASKGRCFFLFTSKKALNIAYDMLSDSLSYPLFKQGDLPKNSLLEAFRASGNGVLLGTNSFWEGVDVRGEALSCVIIDKLPFSVPNDPVVQARDLAAKHRGEDPFLESHLPKAVIHIKQAVGRLIRDILDYGVVVLCDPRVIAREYGRQFISSLPSMPRTRELDLIEQFFRDKDEIISD